MQLTPPSIEAATGFHTEISFNFMIVEKKFDLIANRWFNFVG